MLHYAGHTISFQEVPDETSLVILVADCPHRCPGCHSPDLWEKTGISVRDKLEGLIAEYSDAITCVCFMGEGQDTDELFWCADFARSFGYKTAIYSGYNTAWMHYFPHFTYYKCGPFIERLGGLNSQNTNQFMLKQTTDLNTGDWQFEDITYRFQRSND